jgi:hypothetical protein
VQIAPFRNDEDVVGLNVQPFRDEFNRHLGEEWENLVESGGNGSQVIRNPRPYRLANVVVTGYRRRGPPAEPPTQTTGKFFAAFLAFIGNHFVSDLSFILPVRADYRKGSGFGFPIAQL